MIIPEIRLKRPALDKVNISAINNIIKKANNVFENLFLRSEERRVGKEC